MAATQAKASKEVRKLARLWGIQPAYRDIAGVVHEADSVTLVRLLQELGCGIQHESEAADFIRERRQEWAEEVLGPVVVVWEGGPHSVPLRLPIEATAQSIDYQITLENGNTVAMSSDYLLHPRAHEIEGHRYIEAGLPLPHRLPIGYHRLSLHAAGTTWTALLLVAPPKVYSDWRKPGDQLWGLFSPLYAVHRDGGLGAGDFRDLQQMIDSVAQTRGELVATLPLVASFVQQTGDPSPYSPASRLFWNEIYLDLEALPGYDAATSPINAELFRDNRLLDVQALMTAKRAVLQPLAELLFRGDDPQLLREFEEYRKINPDVDQYARFRATNERHGMDWFQWPAAARQGDLSDDTLFDHAAYQYHLYVQFMTDRQLAQVATYARAHGQLWYTDMPLGVSRDSYDVWSERDAFALTCSGGAPPDGFFTKGQDWGFPPQHPIRSRRQHHRYFIRTLRRQLEHANLLRIDHAMGLHRLYWVPHGFPAKQGAYVRYPTDEHFAILSIESHRRRCGIVAENLGTVPPAVDAALARHGVMGMYVVLYEINADAKPPLRKPKPTEAASINTHDMPTFARWWHSLDIDDRFDLGLMSAIDAKQEKRLRAKQTKALAKYLHKEGYLADKPEKDTIDPAKVLAAVANWLAASDSPVLLLNAEDLWLETEQQNIPGTWKERPNWRRKLQFPWTAAMQRPDVVEILREVADKRG